MLANHWNLVAKYDNYKRRKARNLPKSSKKIWQFHNFPPQKVMIFLKIFKLFPWPCCLSFVLQWNGNFLSQTKSLSLPIATYIFILWICFLKTLNVCHNLGIINKIWLNIFSLNICFAKPPNRMLGLIHCS
jgi:hypothetical protein